jgi:hypothetical protein
MSTSENYIDILQVSVFEIFFAWHTGMTLCSATNDIMFRDIEAVIRNMHITHLSLTPTVAALVRPGNVPEVRLLVTAGEGLTAKVHHDWTEKGLYQGESHFKTCGEMGRIRAKLDNWQATVHARLQTFAR